MRLIMMIIIIYYWNEYNVAQRKKIPDTIPKTKKENVINNTPKSIS